MGEENDTLPVVVPRQQIDTHLMKIDSGRKKGSKNQRCL